MTLGEREARDLQRAQAYLGVCRHEASDTVDGVRRCCRCDAVLYAPPQNLNEALFGPYTCTRCPSYGHKSEDHGEQP